MKPNTFAFLKLVHYLKTRGATRPQSHTSDENMSFNTLQKSKDKLLMMPKFLAKYIEKKNI